MMITIIETLASVAMVFLACATIFGIWLTAKGE